MFDVALIQQCADPGIEIAIVERFIAAAGSENPLAISITSGNRVILPEEPRTPDEAMQLLQHFVGKAVVRVGITQYPAGLGVTDASELSADLVDACGNIRLGTALFGKVYRIVAHAHGTSANGIFATAITAWKIGSFEGKYVFGEPDPGPLPDEDAVPPATELTETEMSFPGQADAAGGDEAAAEPFSDENPNTAGIRVDLTGIGGEALN
jgi:hypothetical protein